MRNPSGESASELITLPPPLSSLTAELFTTSPEDVFNPNLTVVTALGCPVVASVMSSIGYGGADLLTLQAAWLEPAGALTVCMHHTHTTGCSYNCYGFTVTDKEVIPDGIKTAVNYLQATSPDYHVKHGVGVNVALRHLEELREAHPQTDLLSSFGFSFDHWLACLQQHTFPKPLQVAIEQVRAARAQ